MNHIILLFHKWIYFQFSLVIPFKYSTTIMLSVLLIPANSVRLVLVPMENKTVPASSKARINTKSDFGFSWLFVYKSLKAHTDLSTNDDDGTVSSIEKKIPCLMNQDLTVDELQGYRCWSVGWGKTMADGSGDYSNQVSDLLISYQNKHLIK